MLMIGRESPCCWLAKHHHAVDLLKSTMLLMAVHYYTLDRLKITRLSSENNHDVTGRRRTMLSDQLKIVTHLMR